MPKAKIKNNKLLLAPKAKKYKIRQEDNLDKYKQILMFLLMSLVAFAPVLAPMYLTATGPVAPDYYKASFLQSGAVFIAGLYFLQKNSCTLELSLISKLIIAFLSWTVLSLLWVFHFHLAILDLSKFLVAGLVFILFDNVIKNREQVHIILIAILSTSFLLSLVGIAQHFNLIDIFLQAVPPAATFGNRNMAMDAMAPIFPLCFAFFIRYRYSWVTMTTTIVAALMFSYNFYAQNRTGWISIALTMILWIIAILYLRKKGNTLGYFSSEQKMGIFVFIVLISVSTQLSPNGFLFFGDVLEDRLGNINISADAYDSAGERVAILLNSLWMLKENFLAGVGFGNWTVFYPQAVGNNIVPPVMEAGNPSSTILFRQAHNEYIQVITEVGLIGALLILFIIVAFFVSIFKLFKNYAKDEDAIIWAGMLIGIISLGIHAAASFPFRVSTPIITLFTYLACFNFYIKNLNVNTADSTEIFGDKSSLNSEVASDRGIFSKLLAWVVSNNKIIINRLYIKVFLAILFLASSGFILYKYSVFMHAHKLRNIGAGLTTSGRIDDAVRYIEESLRLNPSDPDDAFYVLANLYRSQGRIDLAIETYNKAFATSLPYHPYMVIQLAQAHLQKQDIKEAEDTLLKFIERMPKQSGYYTLLARIYAATGRNDDAIEIYEKSIEVSPKSKFPWLAYADYIAKTQGIDKTIEIYERANNYITDPDIYYNLGNAYYYSGMFDKIIPTFEKVIEISPNYRESIQIYSNLAANYWRLGNYDRAIELYASAIEYYQNNKNKLNSKASQDNMALVYADAGDLYTQLQMFDKALPYLSQALLLNPRHPLQGQIYASMWFIYKQTAQEDRLFELEPNSPYMFDFFVQLGKLYSVINDQEQARIFFERAKDNAVNDNDKKTIEDLINSGTSDLIIRRDL